MRIDSLSNVNHHGDNLKRANENAKIFHFGNLKGQDRQGYSTVIIPITNKS